MESQRVIIDSAIEHITCHAGPRIRYGGIQARGSCLPHPLELSRILESTATGGGGLPEEVVLLGHPQSPRTNEKTAYTIKRHWDGILRWFTSKINNGILEGINSLIQAAKAKARGYRTTKYLITMIYLIGGKLEFKLPT